VKVLNRTGRGGWFSVIRGVDWGTASASKITVAHMSLGSDALPVISGNLGETSWLPTTASMNNPGWLPAR
ncbi:MAG: S8 family peptidase, partial [Chloroflexota bacterium]|nr:S8 family peptidase [Chloroflexota bacterium]